MDIYELQLNEHERILHLLQLVKEVELQDIGDVFNRFRIEWSAYKIAKEQTFLKTLLEKDGSLVEQIEQIRIDHAKLEELCMRLRQSEADVEEIDQAVGEIEIVLKNNFAAEAQLFNHAKKLLNQEEADNLAIEMSTIKLDFEKRLMGRLTG